MTKGDEKMKKVIQIQQRKENYMQNQCQNLKQWNKAVSVKWF